MPRNYLQSPYYMCICSLWDATKDEAAEEPGLSGMLVSSLHRLKDTDNTGEHRRDSAIGKADHFRCRIFRFSGLDREE